MSRVLCLILTIQIAMPLRGEIIDRIVAVVDKHIITLSDIRTERTIRQVLGEPTPENDRELLDELIDQHLIHSQLESVRDSDPENADIDTHLAQIRDYHGLSSEIVREAVREHLRREFLVDSRFRQFTTATAAEIQKYYATVFVPAARSRGLSPIPGQQEVESLIKRNVVEEKVAAQMKAWLLQKRKTTLIEILP